jgi:hypothetical protein
MFAPAGIGLAGKLALAQFVNGSAQKQLEEDFLEAPIWFHPLVSQYI